MALTEAERAHFRELGARQQPTEDQLRKIAEIFAADAAAKLARDAK